MSEEQSWEPCPQGTLDDVARQQKTNTTSGGSRVIPMALAAAACVLLMAYAGTAILSTLAGPDPNDVTCEVAIAKMSDYHQDRLSENEIAAIDSHLSGCTACRKKYKSAFENLTHYLHKAYRVAFASPLFR